MAVLVNHMITSGSVRTDLAAVARAYAATPDKRHGALVDIRPKARRAADGEIPGAVAIERNVLEWRLDPRSDARLPADRYDLPVVVVCDEGYTSSLAAASLRDLGLFRATDLIGGFAAWRAAGLPVTGSTDPTVPQPPPADRSAASADT